MLNSCWILVTLFAVGLAAPNYVKWFDMVPAKKISDESQNSAWHHRDNSRLAKTEFGKEEDEFESFKSEFSKIYETVEEEKRKFETFVKNLEKIKVHNRKYNARQKSFYLGVNQFADMSFEEYVEYNQLDKALKPRQSGSEGLTFLPPLNVATDDLPKTVNWTEKGYVTPVKNQGQCGSCWSFSTTGSMEGQYKRKNGRLLSFSEQQLVDCSGKYGNDGCGGGLMDNAFKYIEKYGLELENEYKYHAKDEKCHYNRSEVVTKCRDFVDVPHGDETALKQAVATQGPVSIAIDASHESFQLYDGGVYDETECSSTELDHGVLAVGYGTDKGYFKNKDYWLVKNSWGPKWGMAGYVKMTRNKNNQCGVATQASYPVL